MDLNNAIRTHQSLLFCFYLCKFRKSSLSHNSNDGHATPNGYIVTAEFGVHFLPRRKNVPSKTNKIAFKRDRLS